MLAHILLICCLYGVNAFYHGMSFVGGPPKMGTIAANLSLANMKPLGINWASVVTTWYQTSINSTTVAPSPGRSDSDEQVEATLQEAERLGISVLLKPHIDPEDGNWRGHIGEYFNEQQWKEWFSSYTFFITHFAEVAQKYPNAVKLFSVGCEYVTPSKRTNDWKNVIASVRKVWKGPITYAANWGSEIDTINWINELDVIGVDAYYPLTNSTVPSLQDLLNGWKPLVPHLANISKFWGNKKVLFTEIGYKSIAGGAINPGDWSVHGPVNVTQQSLCYEATLETFSNQDWWLGIMWWAWSTNPTAGGRCDTDYTPQDKPASIVLQKWYSGGLKRRRTPVHEKAVPIEIYANGVLNKDWENYSWGGTIDLTSSVHTYPPDKYSIFSNVSNWGALALHNPGITLDGYTTLSFAILGGKNLQISLFDNHNNPLVWIPLNKYSPTCELPQNSWLMITIPIEDLLYAPHTLVTQIAIQGEIENVQWWTDKILLS